MSGQLSDQSIRIDGSHGEGGGQILRTSLTMAALLGRELEIYNIRAGRKKPGLQAQHLTSARAVAEIVDGELSGDELGSMILRLAPGRTKGGEFEFDVSRVRASAGSTGMILQTILPLLSLAPQPSRVTLRGGTHTPWSPPIDYLTSVFLPMVSRMRVRANLATERWGWYPMGGGVVRGGIEPVTALGHMEAIERGHLTSIRGISAVSNLPRSIAERQRGRALRRLREEEIRAEMEIVEAPSIGQGTFLILVAAFEGVVVGFDALGAKGKRAEVVADEAVDGFLSFHRSGTCVDPHLADQLVIYMALARGRSAFTTSRISQHLLTNIWVLEQFLPVKFDVTSKAEEAGQVSVEGLGFVPPR